MSVTNKQTNSYGLNFCLGFKVVKWWKGNWKSNAAVFFINILALKKDRLKVHLEGFFGKTPSMQRPRKKCLHHCTQCKICTANIARTNDVRYIHKCYIFVYMIITSSMVLSAPTKCFYLILPKSYRGKLICTLGLTQWNHSRFESKFDYTRLSS